MDKPTTDAAHAEPAHARRRADDPRRGAARRRLDRHRLEGAERRRPAAPGDPRQGAARRPRDRLPAQRPRPEPAPRQVAHHRHHLQRQFRPLHLPDRRGAGGAARRRGHRGLHVQRHRRSRRASASISTSCSASASTAWWSPRGAPTSAPPIGPLAHGLPVVYVFSQADDPDALCLLPDDEGGARARGRASGRARPPAHRAYHRARAFRGGAAAPRAAIARRSPRPGSPSIDGFYLPGVWSEAWGREAVGRLFDGRPTPPDALFCGNDQIARGAAERCASAASRCPATWRSSASTIGKSWRWPPARR